MKILYKVALHSISALHDAFLYAWLLSCPNRVVHFAVKCAELLSLVAKSIA